MNLQVMTDALEAALYARIAELQAQIDELRANALVRAHRQRILVDALTAIRDKTMDEEIRQIARRAVAQIEEVRR